MTPKERAEDLIGRFDEPVRDKTNYRVQAMLSMTEEAITAAIEDERNACVNILENVDADSYCGFQIAELVRQIRARDNKSEGTK